MTLEEATGLLTFVCVLAALIFMIRLRRSKIVYIADYQIGLRYLGDASCRVLPPGAYRSGAASPPITVVDMRPRQFLIERLEFQDRLQENCVVSLGGELTICDAESAVNSFKNLIEDTLPIVRERLRSAVSKSIIDSSAEGRAKMANLISADLNRELQVRGVELHNIEITELWIQPMRHPASAHAN